MNKLLIISKPNCAPCTALKTFILSLPEECQEKVTRLDESTSSQEDLHNILKSYGSYGFPTLILQSDEKERVVTGFGKQTIELIKNHIECY